MGVVAVSGSAARSPIGLNAISQRSTSKRPLIVAFRADKSHNPALVASIEQIPLQKETPKQHQKRRRKGSKSLDRVKAIFNDEASLCTLGVDYNEAADKLENIYKLSPTIKTSDVEDTNGVVRRVRQRRKRTSVGEEKSNDGNNDRPVVRNLVRKPKRLSLDERIELRKKKDEEVVSEIAKNDSKDEHEKIEKLVREYSSSTDFVSLDWKKMKIPPVLSSTEHTWLFKLMQPMKAFLQVKEQLQKDLGREPTDVELAEATNMNAAQVKKCLEVGRAARNKLIKHNLRLVLFVINKYFQDFADGPRFHDLCQAGVKGLITAIDRFEPKRRFRLSTYGLFWIRHAITRSLTASSFTRIPFGFESVIGKIQRAKLELLFETNRVPTDEEIIQRVGISPERYHEVMKASKPILSLHSRHAVTEEEFINQITDSSEIEDQKQSALLRLALDDVLDSLKPKESLVIRQRFGLDGKGDRTLEEIAGNLNISREMVRKHEAKALMKLKHPTRVEYLRQHMV